LGYSFLLFLLMGYVLFPIYAFLYSRSAWAQSEKAGLHRSWAALCGALTGAATPRTHRIGSISVLWTLQRVTALMF
jgi:ABC-type uncharacterized transport system permease subunit